MANLVLRAIVPKGFIVDVAQLQRDLPAAMNHGMAIVRDDFRRTVRTWKRPAKFTLVRATQSGGNLVAQVFTTNEIYGYVDRGTEAHIIRPRRAARLRFRTGFKAKTRPGVVGSRAGGSSGPVVWAREVRHPGTRARNFSKTIARRRERNVINLLRAAFLKSLRGRPTPRS